MSDQKQYLLQIILGNGGNAMVATTVSEDEFVAWFSEARAKQPDTHTKVPGTFSHQLGHPTSCYILPREVSMFSHEPLVRSNLLRPGVPGMTQ
jgi:hypothetical protein